MGAEVQRRYRPWRRSGHWLIFPNSLVSKRLTICFLHSGRCRIAGTVGCCCVLLRQSDICIGGWDWRSWTRVSNCAFWVFFTGQQSLDIVVTLGHNLGKDLAGFVSGVGCQVFHGISGFWVRDACITGSVIVWLPRSWIFILKCSAKVSSASYAWPFNTLPPLIGLRGSMCGIQVPPVTQLGTTSVAWYNLHFRLMIATVNCFLLCKKWKKPYILLWID
jgi:hypothetical protein